MPNQNKLNDNRILPTQAHDYKIDSILLSKHFEWITSKLIDVDSIKLILRITDANKRDFC